MMGMEVGVEEPKEQQKDSDNKNLLTSQSINSQQSQIIKYLNTQNVPNNSNINLNIPSEKKNSTLKSINTNGSIRSSKHSQNIIQSQAQITEVNNQENQENNSINNQNDKHSEHLMPQSIYSTVNMQANQGKSLHLNSSLSSQASKPDNANQSNVMGSQQFLQQEVDSSPINNQYQPMPQNQIQNINQQFAFQTPNNLNEIQQTPEGLMLQKRNSQFIESQGIYTQQSPQQYQFQNQPFNIPQKETELIESHSIYKNVPGQTQPPQPQPQPQPEQNQKTMKQEEIDEMQKKYTNLKLSKTKYLSEEELSKIMIDFNNDNNEKKDEIDNNNDINNSNNDDGKLDMVQEVNDSNNLNINEGQAGEGEGEGEGERVQSMKPPNPLESIETLYNANIIDNNNDNNNNQNNVVDNNSEKNMEDSKSEEFPDDTQLRKSPNLTTNDNKNNNMATASNIFKDDFENLSKTNYIQEEKASENNIEAQEPLKESVSNNNNIEVQEPLKERVNNNNIIQEPLQEGETSINNMNTQEPLQERDTSSNYNRTPEPLEEREISIKKHPVRILKIEGEEERQFCPDFISDLLNKIFG